MNFLKYFFLFSVLIIIPSFASEQAVEAVLDTTTLNLHAAAPYCATNPHLAEALQLTEQFIAFELDNYDKERARTQKFFSNPHVFLKNVVKCQTIQQKLMSLDQGGESLENVLTYLFDQRFIFLETRRTLYEKFEVQINQKKKVNLYGLTRPKDFEQQNEEQKFLAQTSTDRYQLINRLILSVWKLVEDPRKLSAQLKLRVRCSTKLWDLLTDKTDYWGHPDEGFVEYDDEKLSYPLDCENYSYYLELYPYKIILMNYTRSECVTYLSSYEFSLTDKKQEFDGKISEAPYPDWLKPHLKTANVVPSKTLQIPKAEEETAMLARSASPADTAMPARPTGPAAIKKLTVGKDEEGYEESKAALTSPISAASSSSSSSSSNFLGSAQPGKSRKQPKGTDVAPWGYDDKVKDKKRQGPSNIHQETIYRLFNPKQFQTVSYGEIKTAWENIFGKGSVIESTGSSHKYFKTPDGRKFSTFSHGNSMTYTDRTIPYIREAFEAIGYGPITS